MAKIIGTAGSAPAAKPKKVHVKAHTRTIPAPKPKPTPRYKVPAGDRAGATGIAKANAYKRTPAYKRIVRQSYAEQSLPQRRADVAAAERVPPARRTTEQQQIAVVHDRRHALDVLRARLGAFDPNPVRGLRQSEQHSIRALGSLELSGYKPSDADLAKKLHWTPAQLKSNKALLTPDASAAGFHAPGVLDKAVELPGLVIGGAAKSAAALADATYHDPIGVPVKTAKQLALATAAVIPGTVHLALHPVHDSQAIVNSMYDSYAEPFDKKVAHIRKEGGLQDAINVATVLGPTSKALALGKYGTLERAGLRVSGGLVKARAPRSGLLTGLAGKAIDEAKGKRYERLAAKGKELTGQQRSALEANRAAGRVVEVVPSRVRGRVIRDVAKVRGRSVNELHYDLRKGDFGQAAKKLAVLDPKEKKALWFAAAGGIRTADQARELLPRLKEKILAERGDKLPKGRYKKMDMVQRIDEVLAAPEKHFTARLDQVMNDIQPHVDRISARDPRYADLTKEARRRADQNVLMGLEQGVGAKPHITAHDAAAGLVPDLRYTGEEPTAAFVARGDKAAADAGLRKPMYFKAERHRGEQADHSAFAVGGGRAMALEGKHEGRNLSKGILDMSERAFLRGYARNVKAAHNWPLVEKLVDRHAYHDLTPGPGLDVGHALDAINQATPEIKPGDVSLFNPGIFRKHLEDHTDQTAGTEGLPEDQSAANIVEAMNAAKIEHGQGVPSQLQRTNGWKAVPTSMLRELEAEMKSGTKGGRVLDIMKGKASRAILLTANVPWLAIQAASEGGVTALATKGSALNPVNWLGTRQWWKGMTHEQRQEVSGVLGLNSTAGDLRQTRLGATSSTGFVNSYRAMKEAPIWHKDRKWLAKHGVSELNPAELMAAADRGKTNVTRLLMAHSELKKAAVADMAKNMSHFDKAATQLMSVFKRPVHEQYDILSKNPHLIEDVAEKAVEWLGDWTTMTAAERKVVNRMTMFYPYVRYATRLLFYTLPVKHPIVATALAEIGQLTQEEYHKVFGNDDLPWNIGKIYFGKTGDSKYIDLSRANPLMTSAITALGHLGTPTSNVPGAVVGTLPPYGQWMVDQLTGVDTFKGRALRLHGDTDPRYKKPGQISLADHAKLGIAEVQSLFYPAREAMNRLHPQTQSDESSLLFPVPMQYKKASEITGGGQQNTIRRLTARNAEADQKFNQQHSGGLAGLVLGPLLPTPSRDAASSKNRQYIAKLQAKADKVAAQRKAYRDSHGGKNPTKPKSPFGGSSHKVFSG